MALERGDGAGAVTGGVEEMEAQQAGQGGVTGRERRERSCVQVAEVGHTRGGWGETAAVATGGCQDSPPLQMLLQMLRKFLHLNSHHVEQP